MIERFPLPLNNFWAVVLSSALATRIDWSTPFQTDDAAVFRSGWRDDVRSVLRTPERGHHCAIARHPEAGDVADRAWAEGLHVTSVIAAPEVPAATVLAAAHDAARVRGHRFTPYALVDLPHGDGIAWTIANVRGQGSAERFAAVLPAWSATSEHDLGAAPFGFVAAARVLERLGYGDQWDARQAAVARYHRTGFAAAAVTSMAVAVSFSVGGGEQRAALLRFDRPYAVVATATGPGAWSELPVFSAWVTRPHAVAAGDRD